jgi:internalin A
MRPLIKRITGDTRSGKEKIMSHLTFFVKRWSKQELDLSFLELDELTPKLFDLQSIKHLNLSNNHLKCIPEDIKNLDRLETLDISFNEISSFPELQKLPSSLKRLILRGNNITEVRIDHAPEESNLISLDLESNKIRSFLYFSASRSGLRELNLRRNHLKVFRISAPSSLESLDLSQNSMKSIDCETLSLDLLRQVFLCENELKSIPSFVFSSPLLEKLDISSNKLSYISDEMAPRLTKLQSLYLSGNNLSYLPENLFLLENLQEIKISENNIKILNPSISRLSNLNFIELLGNPIESPPKAVIEQGSSATIRFLREIDSQSASGIYHRLWISKLMVVGEGGVGKTSLIKALKGESCDPAETTTHGIQLDKIEILHPYESEILMNLNIWDFGGQQIYHATHQFFLTDNSVFIFAWNSRTEFNQGRPYYWLDMITANAPNAPIILVATHLDQRRELIPLDYLREKYPQIIDFFEVSNIDQKNIDLLYAKIRELAAGLPLMGKPWPERWDEASAALKKIPEKLISRNQLFEVFKEHSLDVEESEILAKYLHDLGEILQYPESEALKELVVLKPQWISEHISKVITNDSVLDSKGILHQDVISEEWADLDKSMQELFLELMEQYDLAYKIPGDKANRALIVEQLSS